MISVINRKIAIFNSSGHSINLGRQVLLAKKFNFELAENNNLFKHKLKNAEKLMFSDDIDIFCLLNLFKEIFYNKRIIELNIIFLELYTISFNSLLNEIFWNLSIDNFSVKELFIQLYYTPKRFIRFILFRLLLKKMSCNIYLPSTLRIEYVKNILSGQHVYYRVRNLLFDNSEPKIDVNLNFKPYTYLFIAGNIYYLNDFQKVCDFAFSHNLKIVVTSKKKLPDEFYSNFHDTIIQTGPLQHHQILSLTKNCLAGVAVFSKNNINQKMAASSKIYEYAAYGKPIIVSRVPGIVSEVNEFSLKNIFYIDQLNLINLKNIPFIQTEFNELFSFNNELLSLYKY
jgi:hypothetical protein